MSNHNDDDSADDMADEAPVISNTLCPIPPPSEEGMLCRYNYNTVIALYCKSVCYHECELFRSGPWSQTGYQMIEHFGRGSDNFLFAVFFGIWSFQTSSEEGEFLQEIEIPIRARRPNDQMPNPVKMWKTGDSLREPIFGNKENPAKFNFKVAGCHGNHTEENFITYVKKHSVQRSLRKTSLESATKHFESEQLLNDTSPKLECFGFKLVSGLDACDSCLVKLQEFRRNSREYLPHIYNHMEFDCPFVITLESIKHYYSDRFRNNPQCVATLKCLAPMMRPVARIVNINEEHKEGSSIMDDSQRLDLLVSAKHKDRVTFEDNEQLQFICLKVQDGHSLQIISS